VFHATVCCRNVSATPGSFFVCADSFVSQKRSSLHSSERHADLVMTERCAHHVCCASNRLPEHFLSKDLGCGEESEGSLKTIY
jgi:hypothetical protein